MRNEHFQHPSRLELAILAILLAALGLLIRFQLMPDSKHAVGQLRVAMPAGERFTADVSPYGPGFERELAERFCAQAGLTPRFISIDDWEQGRTLLERGRADLLVGRGLGPDAFADLPEITAGPPYAAGSAVLVHAHRRADPDAEDCLYPVMVQDLPSLQRLLAAAEEAAACAGSDIASAGPRTAPVLDAVSSGEAALGVADDAGVKTLRPFYPNLKTSPPNGKAEKAAALDSRWFWRADHPQAESMRVFFASGRAKEIVEALTARYFGFLPEDVDHVDLRHLRGVVREHLRSYREILLAAAREHGIDPLLLVAVIYQESRFDPRAVSHTGVRGMMQISLDTARRLGIKNRMDPRQNIRGGAAYLRLLHGALPPEVSDPWERWFLTLAAYNQGLGHVQDAMRLAAQKGLAPDAWHGVKKALKLLSRPKFHSRSRHGHTRGLEGARFVDSVRYWYFVLSGLAVLPGPEAEHLAPLRAAPAGWPS